MKIVKGLLKIVCNAFVLTGKWVWKQLCKIWKFNKKHHCITYDDDDSLENLYDWDDDNEL